MSVMQLSNDVIPPPLKKRYNKSPPTPSENFKTQELPGSLPPGPSQGLCLWTPPGSLSGPLDPTPLYNPLTPIVFAPDTHFWSCFGPVSKPSAGTLLIHLGAVSIQHACCSFKNLEWTLAVDLSSHKDGHNMDNP